MATSNQFSFRASQERKEQDNTSPEMQTDNIDTQESMTTDEYIREHAAKNGVIGGIRGIFLAVVDFISQAIGTVVRNLLWSERVQDSMASRIRGKDADKKEDKNVDRKDKNIDEKENNNDVKKKNKDKESEKNRSNEEKKEKDNPDLDKENNSPIHILKPRSFYNERLKWYDAEITKDLEKIAFKDGQDSFIVPFKGKEITADMFVSAFLSRDGNGIVKAAMNSALLAAAISEQPQNLRIPIGAGAEHIEIDIQKENDGAYTVFFNDEKIVGNIPESMFINPNNLEMLIKEPVTTYAHQIAEKNLTPSFQISDELSIQQDVQGHIIVSAAGEKIVDTEIQSDYDLTALRQTLISTGQVSPGKAFAITSLYAPAVKDYMDCRVGDIADGSAHLVCRDGQILQYCPKKEIESYVVPFHEGDFSKADRGQNVMYELDGDSKRDIPFIAETWKDIAYAQNIDKKEFQNFLNRPSADWNALHTKDGELSFFRHADGVVYHRYIDPSEFADVKHISDICTEDPIKSLSEGEQQTIFNGRSILFIDEHNSCAMATSDGNEIHLMNLDERISGFSYKMQESEPIHIPEPHTLSQEDFDTFLEKVEEYYQDAAECRDIAPDYEREQFPLYESSTVKYKFCECQPTEDLALDGQPEKEFDDLDLDIDEDKDYSDIPNYGHSSVPPEEMYRDMPDEEFFR